MMLTRGKALSLSCLVVLLMVSSVACSARFSAAGDGGNGALGPPSPPPSQPPDPKPEPWEGGFSQIQCDFIQRRQSRFLGVAGMLDQQGQRFQSTSYELIQFAEEGWIWVNIGFPGHDSTGVPVVKPHTVEVEYYIFLRPDPWIGENFFEVRRTVRGSFEMDEALEVHWPFTRDFLKCKIQKPQQ